MNACKTGLSFALSLGLLLVPSVSLAGPGADQACGFGLYREQGASSKFFFDFYRTGTTDLSYVFGPSVVQGTFIGNWGGTVDYPGISREIPAASGFRKFFLNTTVPVSALAFVYGTDADEAYRGNWDGNAGGTDYIGIKRNVGGVGKYLLDYGDGGLPDMSFSLLNFTATTVPGLWGSEHGGGNSADGVTNIAAIKVIGVGLKWIIRHTDGSYTRVNFGTEATDTPQSGDFDGDGIGDLAVVRDIGGGFTKWLIDTDWDGVADYSFNYGTTAGTPMVCDWDGDGADDPGYAEVEGNKLMFYTKNDLVPGAGNDGVRFGVGTDSPIWGVWTDEPAP